MQHGDVLCGSHGLGVDRLTVAESKFWVTLPKLFLLGLSSSLDGNTLRTLLLIAGTNFSLMPANNKPNFV